MAFVDTREEKEVVLSGRRGEQKFVLKQYDAFKGVGYQKKLIKILAPSFMAMQDEVIKEDGSWLAVAIQKFIENIDQVEPAFLKELVVNGAQKEGRVMINFENDFAGNYGVLFSLIKEIIVFNYEDLFQLLGSDQAA